MSTDIEIAQAAQLQKILPLAHAKLGLPEDALIPYGHYKAKLALPFVRQLLDDPARAEGHLVLVTAISPTPPGEGKTTTTVGLGDGLSHIGKRSMICLREPSLGPCFGMKGGAAGGGRAQVLPMEDINLHFTGDFHAIGLAHNLLAALLDNHIHQGNTLDIDVRRISWRRVVDMNDRALRQITVALGGPANGYPREDGFDIVVASEVMAILCLSASLAELKQRLGDIVVGYTREQKAVTARDLKADGAMAVLLKDALAPNLVQTIEGTPAFVHGGPFANIAHGCNTLIATRSALRLADYVVTEAGFGADLGAEKFIDIKCRKGGLKPACAVIVATVRALRHHGGTQLQGLAALQAGLANLRRHAQNVTQHYQLPAVVSINRFDSDSAAEIEAIERCCAELGVRCVLATHWAQGGAGAAELARAVVELCETPRRELTTLYPDDLPLDAKIRQVAQTIYRAASVDFEPRAAQQLKALQAQGFDALPVCIAKTQYSFSSDAKLLGAPEGHVLRVRELRLNAGAGFVTAICGDIMTMPGLPKQPAAERIGLDDAGVIHGLF